MSVVRDVGDTGPRRAVDREEARRLLDALMRAVRDEGPAVAEQWDGTGGCRWTPVHVYWVRLDTGNIVYLSRNPPPELLSRPRGG